MQALAGFTMSTESIEQASTPFVLGNGTETQGPVLTGTGSPFGEPHLTYQSLIDNSAALNKVFGVGPAFAIKDAAVPDSVTSSHNANIFDDETDYDVEPPSAEPLPAGKQIADIVRGRSTVTMPTRKVVVFSAAFLTCLLTAGVASVNAVSSSKEGNIKDKTISNQTNQISNLKGTVSSLTSASSSLSDENVGLKLQLYEAKHPNTVTCNLALGYGCIGGPTYPSQESSVSSLPSSSSLLSPVAPLPSP